MALKLITAPASEPVTLAEAKAHLRVDVADDDALIASLISAARANAENICRRAFVTQQWDLYLDGFPAYACNGGKINLPFPALQSVQSVKYTDSAGALQTLAAELYLVDTNSEPGSITPAPNTYWPDTQLRTSAVQISYTVGYGDAEAVPEAIKAWILMRVGALYENRESTAVGSGLSAVALPFVDTLLDQYRVRSYG